MVIKEKFYSSFHNALSELINFHGVKSFQRKRDVRKTYRAPIACFWTHFLVERHEHVKPLRSTLQQESKLPLDSAFFIEEGKLKTIHDWAKHQATDGYENYSISLEKTKQHLEKFFREEGLSPLKKEAEVLISNPTSKQQPYNYGLINLTNEVLVKELYEIISKEEDKVQ